MGAREQPLLSIITTAGSNLGGPCYEKRRDVIRILEGQVTDETIFGIIYGIDDDDDWTDIASLIKANPNYGISVFPEFLQAQLDQARRSASKQNAFKTKHLNQWVGARAVWMNMLVWQKQKTALTLEDMAGCPCWMAVDLASKKDVAALVMLFLKEGHYYCVPKFYAPESAGEENDKYRDFATDGHLTLTPGNMTDYAFIEQDILDLAKVVDLQDLAFDDWQANYLITRLANTSLNVVDYNQTVKNMSEPMKETEAHALSGTLWHDGNPMMTWMMGNVAAKIDAKENIYPRKESDNDPNCKIDGPVALIMAMGRAIVHGVSAPHAYETRGFLTL
jgi:phage terminase large subunit-like protein